MFLNRTMFRSIAPFCFNRRVVPDTSTTMKPWLCHSLVLAGILLGRSKANSIFTNVSTPSIFIVLND